MNFYRTLQRAVQTILRLKISLRIGIERIKEIDLKGKEGKRG